MPEGATPNLRRLPFVFQTSGGVGRLVLEHLPVGPFVIDRLELEVAELGTDPGVTPPERFQRRRTRLRALAVKIPAGSIDDRLAHVRKQLAALGITQLSARLNDGYISIRARAADGLAAADISFRIQLVHAGTHLRALASMIRVHGHLPSPGPVIADRILSLLLGATDTAGVVERPHTRGLCDAEIDLINGLLWHLMPPAGWRLPAVADIELVAIKIGRAALEIGYGPPGTRGGDLGVRPQAHQLAAAHDLMHSVDAQLRDGHLEEAMRGYRALLAAGGPDQPLLLERILALASARPAWFFDGLELARQALGRWPSFPPAHNALASISLAQGDAREAAGHLTQLAQLASADGDDDQAASAALAGARLLRVLEPKSATQLYQLALEHDPGSAEAADSLADRLADEQRWPELVRLVRARAVSTADPARAVALRLRLADVFVHQLGDPGSAQQELAAATLLAPEDPAVHEMTATILGTVDPEKAVDAWREVARLAEARSDHRTAARAQAILGDLQRGPDGGSDASETAWRRAIELDPLQADALGGLALSAAARKDHAAAADLLERMRGLGLPQHAAARFELMLARSYLELGRTDDARSSLRRATVGGGETAAEAHAVLAEIAEATFDREHAAAELDTAISSLIDLASDGGNDLGQGDRLYTRAAQLAVARANLFDRSGQFALAGEDYQRAHDLAHQHAPELARDAAKTMLSRAGDDAGTERRWIDAVLATRPPAEERAALLVKRAEIRRKERTPDLAAALADLHEALQLVEDSSDPDAIATRRRAYQLEADLLAQSGDQRARAQALASLAKMAERAADRIEVETAAAAAWLAADEPAAALPHGARAMVAVTGAREGLPDAPPDIPAALRREVLLTLGEAAWRQRAWPDVIRAYRGLIEDPGAETPRVGTFRYRLAVAADRSADPQLAVETLRPLVADADNDAARATSPEMRGQALRLFADLAERAGDLGGAAAALEGFASLAVESSPTARADAMYRAGELFRRGGRDDDAIRCLEAALRISDSHLPALDSLEAAWRERGDLERVAVILGRKVAATARHPARQKPLLSRLGDLQEQLGRPDVALATHQRALEIDPAWRPSLRYVTVRLRDAGQVVAAAGGLAQLAGELPNDTGVDLAIVARERQIAAVALAELVTSVDAAQLEAIRAVAKPALERTSLDVPRGRETDTSSLAIAASALEALAGALARLRGEMLPAPGDHAEEDTQSGRKASAPGTALSLRDAAERSRAAGKLDETFATLETANHVSPGDLELLRELVDLATTLDDHEAAARHLDALIGKSSGAKRGELLLELADICFDQLDDAPRGRSAMRMAAESFGTGKRRDAALRMLASEASTHLAWDAAIDALEAINVARRSAADIRSLAIALARGGRDDDAIAVLEEPTMAEKFADGGELLAFLRTERDRKAALDAEPEEPTNPRRSSLSSAATITGPLATIAANDAPRTTRTPTRPGIVSATPAEPMPRHDGVDQTVETRPASQRRTPTAPPPSATRLPAFATQPPPLGASESGVIKLPGWARPPTQPPPIAEAPAPLPEPAPAPKPPAPLPAWAKPPTVPPPIGEASAPGKKLFGGTLIGVVAPDEEDDAATTTKMPAQRSAPEDEPPRSRTGTAPRGSATAIAVDDLAIPVEPAPPVSRTGTPVRGSAPMPVIPEDTASGRPRRTSSGMAVSPTEAVPEPGGVDEAARTLAEQSAPHITIMGRAPTKPPTRPPERARPPTQPPGDRPKPPSQPPTTGRAPTPKSAALSATLIGRPPTHPPADSQPRPRPPSGPPSTPRTKTSEPLARIKLVTLSPAPAPQPSDAARAEDDTRVEEIPVSPSVIIKGTAAETSAAVMMAAASADRDRLLSARKEHPEDASVLLALLAHLGDREPKLRHDVLEQVAEDGTGRALAIALHELAFLARDAGAQTRAASLWTRAYAADPSYELTWMHVADVLVTEGDVVGARALYEKVAECEEYEPARRAYAAERAEALDGEASVVKGEITPPSQAALAKALRLADSEDWTPAIALAERAASLDPSGTAALLLLERLYLEVGDVTSASEAIGRQLVSIEEPAQRAILWRRRARLYRDTLGRDAEAYRCLKEAHACAPADPEIAYQLRIAAMVRGEWALAASLLYREIAAAANPRDRGALHLELALIYEERLDDEAQAQVNYEQALAFDPTIPAAKLPLARRYEAIGRHVEAARLYEEAATSARPADRGALLDAASRANAAAANPQGQPDLASQLDRDLAAGDHDAATAIAHQLWRAEPGHPVAFKVLAGQLRASSDLGGLTELTSVRASQSDSAEERALMWLEVARLAETQGALDQAARAYDLALIEDPGHVGALDSRGALAFRLGDYATADLIYRDLGSGESVLGADELALRRSIISEQLGRDTEALAHAKVAAAAAPGRRDLVMRVQDLATRTSDLDTALAAARSVLDLIPLDDDDAQLATHFALVDLQRQAGNLDAAIQQLELVLRDHPLHAPALEGLVELQMARADWAAATRYLYQLVPLAPSPSERAERLFRLGETVLVHLGDTDRADDVFLRASDLDPAHVPTLRRLLDVYWRADDPAALVEVATELAEKDALSVRGSAGPAQQTSLAHALIAAALVGETQLAKQMVAALGDEGPRRIADALAELSGREGRLQLQSASTAIAELGRRGLLDLSKVRAAAAGTPVASVLE